MNHLPNKRFQPTGLASREIGAEYDSISGRPNGLTRSSEIAR